jgi:acetylglutamate kinase
VTPSTIVDALLESLPHVQRWSDKTVVVKIGGAAMTDEGLVGAVTEDVVLLGAIGVHVVLVHGGGHAVSTMGRQLGLEPTFVDGLRVTDDATMRVAQMVHVGGLSRDLVAALGRRGGRAIGLSGHDGGGWLRAAPRMHTRRADGETVSLGRVGDITSVDASMLRGISRVGMVPVVAPVAVDETLESLNVNADSVATAVAAALGADKLILLTDVPGIRDPDGHVAAEVDDDTLRRWLADGTVSGGMIPKAEACLSALDGGVSLVTVADGRVAHGLLLELLTDAGVGTMVRGSAKAE